MNNKTIITVLLLFFTISSYTFGAEDNQNVTVNQSHWNNIPGKNRSISTCPVIYHRDGLFFIYSDIDLENLSIEINTTQGDLLIYENTNIMAENEYILPTQTLDSDMYIVTISQGNNYIIATIEL